MKKVLLTNIKRFIKKSTFLFVVFIITQTISVMALEYSVLSFRNQEIERSVYSNGVASFTINFKEGTVLNDILEIIQNIEGIVPSELKQCYIQTNDINETRAYVFGQFQSILYGNDLKKDNDVIIAHNIYEEQQIKIDDSIRINNKEYTVVGVRYFDYSEIPLNSLESNSVIKSLVIETKTIPTNSEIESITKTLQEYFSEHSVSAPMKRNLLSEYSLDSSSLTTLAILFLSMINISYIFKVIISKRIPYYAVSLCCGSTFKRMHIELVIESIIYGLFAILFGTLLFNSLILDILFPQNRFSFLDLLFSIIWSLVIIIIPIISTAISFSSKTIKELIYNRS